MSNVTATRTYCSSYWRCSSGTQWPNNSSMPL